MTVIRFTPEQVRAHEDRLKRIRRIGADLPDGIRPGGPALPERAAKARSFVLRLPVPQSVNHNSRPTASGGRILTDEHKAFRTTVALMVYDKKLPKLYGRLRVYIRINAPGDIDNRVKPVLDALQRAGAIDNDRNVDDLHVARSTLIPSGFLDVEVGEL